MKKILIVEPDTAFRHHLAKIARGRGTLVMEAADFASARRWLLLRNTNFLVANLRLDDYSGIHLVVLAGGEQTVSVVYVDAHNLGIAGDAQGAGAFYEVLDAMPLALPAYLRATLPDRDRRNPSTYGERRQPPAGRRATDGMFSKTGGP
jgi:DNA-binding NtrC family response regulator